MLSICSTVVYIPVHLIKNVQGVLVVRVDFSYYPLEPLLDLLKGKGPERNQACRSITISRSHLSGMTEFGNSNSGPTDTDTNARTRVKTTPSTLFAIANVAARIESRSTYNTSINGLMRRGKRHSVVSVFVWTWKDITAYFVRPTFMKLIEDARTFF